MKGHLVKPSRESSSFCRRLKIIDLRNANVSFVFAKQWTHLVPIGDVKKSSKSPLRLAFIVKTTWTCSKYFTSVLLPLHASVSIFITNDLLDGICLQQKVHAHEQFSWWRNCFYWVSVMIPASQWYLAGTVFHCFASATIAPASSTPKPNKWLNSRPTPFIVQWNLPFASNNELRFDVSTVRCWMSLQVSFVLEEKSFYLYMYILLFFPYLSLTLLPKPTQRPLRLPGLLLKYRNASLYIFHINLLSPEISQSYILFC